ncbi:MAG: FAD-dependent oxidoreductase [Mesorhizobium sp.]
MPIIRNSEAPEYEVDVVVIGSGACGICAGLAASEAGASVLILERDPKPTGSTALSTGLIPAAGTRLQRDMGIEDSAERFARDIMGKAKGQTDKRMAMLIAERSGPTVDWLAEHHGVPFRLVEGFLYPGHSQLRMHGVPRRTGEELQYALLAAAERASLQIVTSAQAQDLHVDDGRRVTAVGFVRPDGVREVVGAKAVVLACNGFGGNPDMLREYIPEMVEAEYWGHSGNTGDAVNWGKELGAQTADLGSYQGHGAVAYPYGKPMMWGLIVEGGFQVNKDGVRFSNEASGYSEQAFEVIRQQDRIAYNIYDETCETPALGFTDYQEVQKLGGIKRAGSWAELAALMGLPADVLERTAAEVDEMKTGQRRDPFGRDFSKTKPLKPPFLAARITGALFHTQGGLVVDDNAQVVHSSGEVMPNLFAGGGAARGVSGPSRWGYLSGNGLLCATVLGRLAGISAARLAAASPELA